MSEQNEKNSICLDYYSGAYGPTIRIDIQSMESLKKIKNVFQSLSHKVGEETNLVDLENIKFIGLNKFILISIPEDQKTEKKLFLTQKDDLVEFFWKTSCRNWDMIMLLVEGLIEGNNPGHQYLTEEGIDDALVELAFLEYRPNER